MLTHTTDWADSDQDYSKHQGLAGFGAAVVGKSNGSVCRDLSHTSLYTTSEAFRVTRAPVG